MSRTTKIQGELFDAVVLAGTRRAGDPLAAAHGVAFKCLVPVAGMPMLLRVVETLMAAPSVRRVALVGDPAIVDPFPKLLAWQAEGRLLVIPPEASPSRSVARAIAQLDYWPLLITTADHPLLLPDLVERFLEEAQRPGVVVAAGLTPAEAILARFPDNKRTYWKFKDGHFSGANLFALLAPEALAAVMFWRRVEEERKRPWRIARLFGISHLLAYLTGRLTLEGAFERASTVIGTEIWPVPLPVAEAAIDVDKPEDLVLAEKILNARESAHG